MNQNRQLKKDQIYADLRHKIAAGDFKVGSKLPSEAELAKQLGVSRITLRSAIKRLKEDGLIIQARGRGTFIANNNIIPEDDLSHGTIMVIHDHETGLDAVWRYIVPGISQAAHRNNYEVTVTTDETLLMFSDQEIKRSIQKDNVIGIIAVMNNFNGDEPIIAKLRTGEIPVVIAHARIGDSEITGFPSIAINELNSWEMAIAHLSEQGFSHIAVLGCKKSTKPFRSHGKAKTAELIKSNGMNTADNLLQAVDLNYAAIQKTVKEFINLPQPPDAILCYSDFFAVYACRAIKELGLKIPDDIAVMGICGYPDAQRLSPALSTVDYGYSEIAQMAVEMVLQPTNWHDPATGCGRMRMKQCRLIAQASTKKQSAKEVMESRYYQNLSLQNARIA